MILHIFIVVALGLFILWCLRRTGAPDSSHGSPHIIKVVRPIMPDLADRPQKIDLPIINNVPEQPTFVTEPSIPMPTPSINLVPDLQTQNSNVNAPSEIVSDANVMTKDNIQDTHDAQVKTTPSLMNYGALDEYTSISKLYQPDKFMDQLREMDMTSKDVPAGRQYDERFSAILKTVR